MGIMSINQSLVRDQHLAESYWVNDSTLNQDGWMDGCIDGCMGRWMDAYHFNSPSHYSVGAKTE